MRKLFLIFVSFCSLFACKEPKEKFDVQPFISDYVKLNEHVIPTCIKEIESMDWYKYNRVFIKEDNPELVINKPEALHYFIVPSLNIPIENLSDFESNILNYLDRGTLSLDNGELLVFEGDSLLLKFSLLVDEHQKIKGMMKSDFNSYLKNTTMDIFESISICFNLTLTDGTAGFPAPTGTFIIRDDSAEILMPKGNLVPVENLYQLFFESNEELDQYIRNIIDLVLKKNN